MNFDDFVDAHKEEYLRAFPGILGIMIQNWMYRDWLAIYYPEESQRLAEECRREAHEWFEERKEFYNECR